MITTFTITEIALNKLDIAEANVRRTGRGNGIEELAASIAAHRAAAIPCRPPEAGQRR